MSLKAKDKYDWNGNKKHTEYYDKRGNKVFSSVERYSPWTGKYTHTDYYDGHDKKVGSSR